MTIILILIIQYIHLIEFEMYILIIYEDDKVENIHFTMLWFCVT